MLIELFKDHNGFVTALRHSWGAGAVRPVAENVYDIPEADLPHLVEFVAGRPVTVSPIPGVGDFASHALGLIAHDIATVEAQSSANAGFMENALSR